MLILDQLKKSDPQLRVLSLVVAGGLVVLLGGLWYVQILSDRKFKNSLQTQSFRTVRSPAVRGKILDRQGRVLADNRPVYSIGLYVEELSPAFKKQYRRVSRYYRDELKVKFNRAQVAELGSQTRYQVASNVVAQLGQHLGVPLLLNEKEFRRHYETARFVPYTVLNNLDPSLIARFQERTDWPAGLELEIQPVRFYPHHGAAAHVLGNLRLDKSSMEGELAFVNYRPTDYRGELGIEGAFDSELRGRAGAKSILVNNLGYRQSENVWLEAMPGRNIVLTIDLDLQKAAEKALQSAGAGTRGAVVVMDVRNGDVLALVSSPAYDPNIFADGISTNEWAMLSDTNSLRQVNRATQGIFAPGSTFKIITGLAGLEVGAIDPKETIHNPGYYQFSPTAKPIGDTAPVGEYDLVRAYKRSCNTYFITQALKPGVLARMIDLGKHLHFGERSTLPLNQNGKGRFPTSDSIASGWRPGDTANLAIGQGAIAVTPLQLTVMISAIANGGKIFWPRIVERTEPQDPFSGEPVVREPAARVRDQLHVNPRNLQIVREAMFAVVEDQTPEGAGNKAYVKGMNICGKTGTAEVQQGRRTVDHITWFASFAPLQSPRYAVVVMVQSGASGGTTCAPVAGYIYREIQKKEAGGRELAQTN